MLEHLEELSHFEDLRPFQSLACILDAYKSDGVLTDFDNAPSFRTLQDQVHQAPYMNLRLRSKWQITQPLFHRHRFQLVYGLIAPARSNVFPNVRQMRTPGGVSLWQLMLDIPIEKSPERRRYHLFAWSFIVEPHEKCLRCLPCIVLGSVQSLFPKDHALSDPPTFRVGLVVTKLPHVRTSLALP